MALSLLLRRSFCTYPQSTQALTTSSQKIIPIYKRRNVRRMVHIFQKLSNKDWFRAQTPLYEKTVERLARSKRYSLIVRVLERQKRYADISNEEYAVRIIRLYGKSNMLNRSLQMFDEMPELNCQRTVLSFNALLEACLNTKNYDELEKSFRELPRKLYVIPNLASYSMVIKGFCKVSSFDSAVSMLDEMDKNGVVPDLITFNMILAGLYKNGRFEDGEKVLALMEAANVVPDVKSYNPKLSALVENKRMSEAVSLVEEMETKGIKADIVSLDVLINGFCKVGNLEEAKRWYRKIRKSGLTPTQLTCSVLIPFACEKGDLDLAVKLFKKVLKLQLLVGPPVLQLVLDALVKESRVEESENLFKLATSVGICWYA